MTNKKKAQWLIVIANILLAIYIVVIGIIGSKNKWEAIILDDIHVPLYALLLIMFGFELVSTITFQTRVWLTSKEKIILAAFIGAFSWMIAGLQGMLLVAGSIEGEGINGVATFFIKMPPVLIATFSGILINSFIKVKGA